MGHQLDSCRTKPAAAVHLHWPWLLADGAEGGGEWTRETRGKPHRAKREKKQKNSQATPRHAFLPGTGCQKSPALLNNLAIELISHPIPHPRPIGPGNQPCTLWIGWARACQSLCLFVRALQVPNIHRKTPRIPVPKKNPLARWGFPRWFLSHLKIQRQMSSPP